MSTIASKLELAPGADVTQPSGGFTFVDYSSDALGEVETDHGKSNEASTSQPARLWCRLRNNDGKFTYLPRGTPIRYSINPGTGYTQVFQGFVTEVTPVWPAGNSQIAEVQIVASGALQRLQQGTPITQSAIYRSTSVAPGLVAYAPLEDPSGSTGLYVQSAHPQNALFAGSVTFAGDTTLGGSKQAIVLGSDSYLGLATQGRSFTGHWTSDWFMKFTGSTPAAEVSVMRCWAASGSVSHIDAVYGGINWGVRVFDAAGGSLGTAIFLASSVVGQNTGWWHWRLMAHDSGSGNTDYQLVTSPISGSPLYFATVTLAGTPGNLTSGVVQPSANLNGVAMAHWSLFDQWNFSAVFSAASGYDRENAVSRLQRLCAEESIEISVTGSSTATMGPQRPGEILALLRDCEAADGGILYDGYTGGLSYLAEQSRYNRTTTLALDANRSQVKLPFQPTKNDADLLNDWTMANPAGDSARFSNEDNVAVNGRYASSATVNLADSDQLLQLAAWRTHLGTVNDLRVPQLQLEMIDRPELFSSALALRPGFNVTADNLLTQFPPGQLGVIAEGIQTTIDATSWRMTVNCSPSTFDTGVLDADPIDCGASVLASTPTASSTTVDVAVSDACVWSLSDGSFPITVKGPELAAPEQMTVTAAGAATTTTPALVAVGTAATADGFGTRTVTPGLPGGATTAGNLLLGFASCRDTNAVDTGMYLTGSPGWQKIYDSVMFAVFAKVHSGSEVAPTLNIPPFSVIVGDTLNFQIASFSGKWGDPRSQLIAATSQLNAAAQDIAYPELDVPLGGVLIVYLGMKADDWTSVATIGGATEIAESFTTAGNDSGIVWDYTTSASAVVIPAGSFVVTGGTSQISRGGAIALRSVSQTLTVTRGVGGTTARSHALGEAVHVTDALVAARQ